MNTRKCGYIDWSKSSHQVYPRNANVLESILDEDTAAALRRDEEEIAALEGKLGLDNKKAKKKLHKEFATQEGFGNDFGDFWTILMPLLSE